MPFATFFHLSPCWPCGHTLNSRSCVSSSVFRTLSFLPLCSIPSTECARVTLFSSDTCISPSSRPQLFLQVYKNTGFLAHELDYSLDFLSRLLPSIDEPLLLVLVLEKKVFLLIFIIEPLKQKQVLDGIQYKWHEVFNNPSTHTMKRNERLIFYD